MKNNSSFTTVLLLFALAMIPLMVVFTFPTNKDNVKINQMDRVQFIQKLTRDEAVKLLWGDGINHDSVVKIANHIIEAGYSLENIVFGSGGALLQQMNRDTMKFAMKCSTVRVNGVWRDVYKDPITDTSKQSKRGAVKLYQHKTDNTFVTAVNKPSDDYEDTMQLVYTNGRLTRNQSLEEIRNLVNL
jgi:nicotinic acid phosphoribosyltransferase